MIIVEPLNSGSVLEEWSMAWNWSKTRVEQKMGCSVFRALEGLVQRGKVRELWVDAEKCQDGCALCWAFCFPLPSWPSDGITPRWMRVADSEPGQLNLLLLYQKSWSSVGGLGLLTVLASTDISSSDLHRFIIKDLHCIYVLIALLFQTQHSFHKYCIFIPYKLTFIIHSILFFSAWVLSFPIWVFPWF